MKRGQIDLWLAFWSVVIAVVLWFMVFPKALSRSRQAFSLPLTTANFDNQKYQIDQIPTSLTYYANVTEQERQAMLANQPHAEVDLSKPRSGNFDYHVTLFPVDLRTAVLEVTPNPSVKLKIERKSSVQMPVLIEAANSPGGFVTETTADPSRVTVSGPESLVAQVRSVRGSLELGGSSSQQPRDVVIQAFDAQNNLISGHIDLVPEKVLATPKFTLKPASKSVPVRERLTGQVPEGFAVRGLAVTPPLVEVSGPNGALKAVGEVQTELIDVSQLTSSQVLTVRLVAPKGVHLNQTEVNVSIKIEPVTVKSLNPKTSNASSETGSTAGKSQG